MILGVLSAMRKLTTRKGFDAVGRFVPISRLLVTKSSTNEMRVSRSDLVTSPRSQLRGRITSELPRPALKRGPRADMLSNSGLIEFPMTAGQNDRGLPIQSDHI